MSTTRRIHVRQPPDDAFDRGIAAIDAQMKLPQAFPEVDHRHANQGVVMLSEPAIEARVEGDNPLPVGTRTQVKLIEADPATRTTRFAPA